MKIHSLIIVTVLLIALLITSCKQNIKKQIMIEAETLTTCLVQCDACLNNAIQEFEAALTACPQGNVQIFLVCADNAIKNFEEAVKKCNESTEVSGPDPKAACRTLCYTKFQKSVEQF